MPVLSYVHQLFNAEQCQAYIHTLRWKERPLQCPRCQSQNVDPWGTYHYRPGCKRYWCNGCKRTFNDLTNTLLHQSKRSLAYWILATFLFLCLACSSRRIAREVGVHIRTSYRWCWWLRNAALSYEMERQLAGTVEADDLYHTAGNKGQAKQGGKKSLGRRARGRRKKREPGRGLTTKIGPPLLRGSVARGMSSSRRPKISPCRRCRRRPTSRCARAVGSIRTRRAATGR
jgi:transposase-like protein